jgi:hypothetical protein
LQEKINFFTESSSQNSLPFHFWFLQHIKEIQYIIHVLIDVDIIRILELCFSQVKGKKSVSLNESFPGLSYLYKLQLDT